MLTLCCIVVVDINILVQHATPVSRTLFRNTSTHLTSAHDGGINPVPIPPRNTHKPLRSPCCCSPTRLHDGVKKELSPLHQQTHTLLWDANGGTHLHLHNIIIHMTSTWIFNAAENSEFATSLTFWHQSWTFILYCTLQVKCEYFRNKKR